LRGIPQPRVFWHARKPFVNSTLKKPFGRVLYTTINVDRLSVDSLSWLLVVSQSAAGWCSRPIGQFTLTRLRHCSDAGVPWSGQLLSAQCPWLACKTPMPPGGRSMCQPAADTCTQALAARRTAVRLVHHTSAAFISAASQTTHASS